MYPGSFLCGEEIEQNIFSKQELCGVDEEANFEILSFFLTKLNFLHK